MPDTLSVARFQFAEALLSYRTEAGLTQEELAEITRRLKDQGILDKSLVREHISKLERPGTGTRAPHAETIHILAEALAVGLHEAGWPDADSATIFTNLQNATKTKIMSHEVSREAAELDAILSVVAEDNRIDLWEGYKAHARAVIARWKERHLRRRQEQRGTPRNPD